MPSLEERAFHALAQDYSPSGSEACAETYETQLSNESELESLFLQLLDSFGPKHALTIEVFFRLFDVLIGLYRLNKCERYLNIIQTSCTAIDASLSVRIRWIQSFAFTRWKQGRLHEALTAFKNLEILIQDDSAAALFENMAHTYSSLGQFDNAKAYFEKSIAISPENNTAGTLLGLGLLHERTGNVEEGIAEVMKALECYECKFSKKGHESSLEAKCCLSLAKMHFKTAKHQKALDFAERAVNVFKRTCGDTSPLVSSAMKVKAEILAILGEHRDALILFCDALSIEATKDEVDLVSIVEIIQQMTACVKPVAESSDCDSLIDETVDRVVRANNTMWEHISHNGNLAAVLKFSAELTIYAKRFSSAKKLLEKALPLFEAETSLDCSKLVQQCTQLLSHLESINA